MALINNLYVCVTDEEVDRGVTVTEHPVEKGIPITDNVKRDAIKLTLSGYIVDVRGTKASTIVDRLSDYAKNGKYVKFIGRTIISDALITDFSTKYTNKIAGGCSFSMEIKEVRIANLAYVKTSKKATTQQVVQQSVNKNTSDSNGRYYRVKKGDCLWTIARKYYGSGTKFSKIYSANKSTIDKRNRGTHVNKYTIYPNQRLLIP